MVAHLKIPLERRNKRTGRTVRTWIGEAVEAAATDG